MRKSARVDSVKGIRIGYLFSFFLVISCCLCIIVFFVANKEKAKYTKLINYKNQYNQSNTAISELQYVSNRLTQFARVFAETQEVEYLTQYFNDVSSYKTRKNLLQVIESLNTSGHYKHYIQMAEKESDVVADLEYYSMRLVCEAINLDTKLLPAELVAVVLEPEDIKLSKTGKISRAKEILLDENYLFAQMNVSSEASAAIETFIEENLNTQARTQFDIEHLFRILQYSVIILFLVAIVIYIIFLYQVLFPLKKSVASIEVGVHIAPSGSYEMQYIAKAYNTLCDKNEVTASVLKHKAEHDPLTGLINRGGFDQIKTALSDSAEPIAYLIVDIDLFKQINDEYGHAIGDDVLRKISNLFMEQFRGSDYVARIGGDEFAIIMTKFGDSPIEIINNKIRRLNSLLQSNSDGLPPVSLSVGVSVSPHGFVKEMEDQADQALYKVKKGGRCNCSFYLEEVTA